MGLLRPRIRMWPVCAAGMSRTVMRGEGWGWGEVVKRRGRGRTRGWMSLRGWGMVVGRMVWERWVEALRVEGIVGLALFRLSKRR